MSDQKTCGFRYIQEESPGTTLLRVKVLNGVNVAKKNIFNASDPYVKISLYRGESLWDQGLLETNTTSTIKRTLNPVWNEEFFFRVNHGDRLMFEMFNSNRVIRDDFIGLVEIPLNSLIIQTESESRVLPTKSYILRPRSCSPRSRVKGTLELYLAYVTTGEDKKDKEEEADTSKAQNYIDQSWEMMDLDDTLDKLKTISRMNEASGALGPINEESEEPLPPDWEVRTHQPSGKKYYINHNSRKTQWDPPPRGERTGNATLPSDWEERQDSNGQIYYINRVTRASQFERPTGESQETPSNEAQTHQSNNEAVNIFRTRRHVSVEDTVRMHNEMALPTSAGGVRSHEEPEKSREVNGGSVADNEEPLPAGWAMSMAPNGRVFYIDHNTKMITWEDPRKFQNQRASVRRTGDASTLAGGSSSNKNLDQTLGPLPAGWEERTHYDGRVFFIDHNRKITQFDDPRLRILGGDEREWKVIPYLEFKKKSESFWNELHKQKIISNKVDIKVSRKQILEDSYNAFKSLKRTDLLSVGLQIELDGESGLDYRSVSMEWFYLLSKEMCNPERGFFEYSATDEHIVQITSLPGNANIDHLSYFEFFGRVAGMAVFHRAILNGFFILPFYKKMLEKPITLSDMELVNLDLYKSLVWIMKNDPVDLDFSVKEDYNGEITTRDLKPNGSDIIVTNENKEEYIDLVIQRKFWSRIEKQMKSFIKGFASLVPLEMIKVFNEHELELLMSGILDYKENKWKAQSAYTEKYNPYSPVNNHFLKEQELIKNTRLYLRHQQRPLSYGSVRSLCFKSSEAIDKQLLLEEHKPNDSETSCNSNETPSPKHQIRCIECVKTIPVSSSKELEAGDHVVFSRGAYDHHGIIVSKSVNGIFTIIQATNTSSRAMSGVSNFSRGKARITRSREVLDFDSKTIHKVVYKQRYPNEKTIKFAKDFCKSEVKREKYKYNLLKNNCEHFATYCATGLNFSVQVSKIKLTWDLLKRDGFVGVSNERERNEKEFENGMICEDCYKMNCGLLKVSLKAIKSAKDVQKGDIIRFLNWKLYHDAVVLDVSKTNEDTVISYIAHYALDVPSCRLIIKRERKEIKLNETFLKLDYAPPLYDVYEPEEVVNRANKRLGEQWFNFYSNDSSHFARWCKLKRERS